MPEDRKYSAVYVSWSTVLNAINQLSQVLPHQIDRSVFPGLAWAIQSQLLTGMKFLGLIDESGKPTAALEALTKDDEEGRKKRLAVIIRERYEELFKLDILRASPLQVRHAMSEHYGVTGATLERALRFFVAIAEYCSIPISPLLAGKKADGSQSTRKRRGPKARPTTVPYMTGEAENHNQGTPPPTGTSRTVKLKSGGTLTLSASLDLFSLIPADRKFVFELIDRLEEYERVAVAQQSASAEVNKPVDGQLQPRPVSVAPDPPATPAVSSAPRPVNPPSVGTPVRRT